MGAGVASTPQEHYALSDLSVKAQPKRSRQRTKESTTQTACRPRRARLGTKPTNIHSNKQHLMLGRLLLLAIPQSPPNTTDPNTHEHISPLPVDSVSVRTHPDLRLLFPCWFLWRTNKPSLLFGPCVAGPSHAAHLSGPRAARQEPNEGGYIAPANPGTEAFNPKRRFARQKPRETAPHGLTHIPLGQRQPRWALRNREATCSSLGLSRAEGLPRRSIYRAPCDPDSRRG